MKAGYDIIHGNTCGKALSELTPVAEINNYHRLNSVYIYYWHDDANVGTDTTTTAIFRLKPKQPTINEKNAK